MQNSEFIIGEVEIEMSARNLSGIVRGTVGSPSLKVRSEIRARDTVLEAIHRQRKLKA